MNLEDYESENTDTDDSDFNPLGAEDSGEESIEEKYEGDDYEDHAEESENKSKKKRKKIRKKGHTACAVESSQIEKKKIIEPEVDPEAEKKRIDALFADFLSGTGTELSQAVSSTTSHTKKTDIPKTDQQSVKQKAPSPPKIFEFAGETVEISNSQNEQSIANSVASKSSNPPTVATKRPAGSGLASVLNQFGKKSKLSVLEKTKLDWDGFKSKEGISEELKTHNRGRDGFLERRDFLERTDFRQFEIEKNMRSVSRRSNK